MPACSRCWRIPASALLGCAFLTHGVGAQASQPHLNMLDRRARVLPATSAGGSTTPMLSAAVPGLGQLVSGRDRGAVYLLAEALFLQRHFTARAAGRRDRDRYIDLAFAVARGDFGAAIRDTAFSYFEEVGKFVASGPFDTEPGPALVPPTDEMTFNGRIWALARQTFFADPDAPPDPTTDEYQMALAFYRRRAVGPNFRWSWVGADNELQRYRDTIEASDDAFRRASRELGFLLANHLLSAVDAYVTERLSRTGRVVAFRTVVAPGSGAQGEAGLFWVVGVRF